MLPLSEAQSERTEANRRPTDTAEPRDYASHEAPTLEPPMNAYLAARARESRPFDSMASARRAQRWGTHPSPKRLFHRDGLREVAGLIHVATAAHRDVVGQQLERHDFEEHGEQFRSRRQFDQVVGSFARKMIALSHDGNHNAVASFYLLNIGHALFIEGHRGSVGFVARR